ncbi:MAG: hypothetical protein RSB52_08635, partial [Acidaminococcaceae bacterium]
FNIFSLIDNELMLIQGRALPFDSNDKVAIGVSIPQADDDGIIGTLNNGQMNGIKGIVTFAEMLMQTAGGTYKVSGGNEPLTPSNQQAKPQEYRGINDLMPCVVGSRIVFVQQQSNIVRDMGYSYDTDKYQGDDVSLLASHLFNGYKVVSMTYQQVPNSVVWCVRSDGVLLGMTYVKEQDVGAWHQHNTDGKFVDICSIAGTTEDELWCVVKRGDTYMIELMAEQIGSANVDSQYFVDSGIIVNNTTKSATISGLEHLEGKTVQILADGNVLPGTIVENGSVTIGGGYEKVIIGLGYISILETLPIEFNGNDGSYSGRKKRISQMMIMFKDSSGGKFGINKNLDEIKWRSSEAWNAPIELYTGKKFVTIPSASYDRTLTAIVKQEDPLPMNILSLVVEVTPGG